MTPESTREESLVVKQYRIKKGVDPRTIKTLPHIITLMMFKDAFLSSCRWHRSLDDNDTVEALADRTFSIVCGAGWAAEAVKLLEDLWKEKVISEETIHRLPKADLVDPRTVWTECVGNDGSAEMKRLVDVRNSCFAHFHNRWKKHSKERYKLAHQVINDLANGHIDVPIVEWTEENGKKNNSRSRNTIAMAAMAKEVYGITDGNVQKPPKSLGEQIFKVGILLERLLAVMIEDAGIEFEPYASAAEAETSDSD